MIIIAIRLINIIKNYLNTENAAAKCLKASVSGPPPAMSNNWGR